MPRTGRIVLSPMLNEAGKLIGDFTVAKAAEGRFLVWGSSAAQIYHMRWFEARLPRDGSVRVERLGMGLVGLMLAGPRSRDVLAALADADVSGAAFRFMDHRAMDVAGCPALVNRISYTGDLGYEIWVEPCYLRTLYLAVKAAGAAHGLADFGMRALLSMRLEKNWPTWFAELRPIYGPEEAAMERFVDLRKPDFIGREAAARERAEGPRLRRVSLAIDAADADVMGDEPIWARVDADPGTVPPGHGTGAPRFGPDGREIARPNARRDGGWRVVGWVTSGGFGHHVGLSLAQGYVPAGLAGVAEPGAFQVEILGQRRPARIAAVPPFDPEGLRMRA
jgi:dimethylglycine dehydrogenase